MQNTIVNVNGQIQKGEEVKISVFDRGFLYGDSLYEVVRTYNGQFFRLKEHLKRLERSAELCRMAVSQSTDTLQKEIEKTLKAFQSLPSTNKCEAYCRLIVSRGVGRIGFGLSTLLTTSQFVVMVQPLETPTREQYNKGFNFKISTRLRNDRRALDPAMKSGNYLNNLLAFLEAQAEGFDDALLCNVDGHITEGTTFNIFYVRRGIIATPPLDIGILEGITRADVIKLAGGLGLTLREVRFPKERLYEADEVFMTSTIKEVFPVTRIDDRIIGDGKPGSITKQLGEAFLGLIR